MGVLRQIAVLVSIATAVAAGVGVWHRHELVWRVREAWAGEIPAATARAWGDAVVWVDARGPAAFARGRIEGALPLDEAGDGRRSGPPRSKHIKGALPLDDAGWEGQRRAVALAAGGDRPVVVYGEDFWDDRADAVARRLRRETGWGKVFVLRGGYAGWMKAGGR